jgi:hypothetical protein
MAEKQRSIFTEKSRKKLKSVDDLERAAQAVGPSAWVTLVAVLALVCGLFAWGFFGTVPLSIQAGGTYDNDLGVLCFVTPEQANRIHEGNAATANGAATTVKAVGGKAYTKDELANFLESQYAADQFNGESNYNFIVSLEENPEMETGAGGLVKASITVESPRPIDLVFGKVLGNA